MTKQDNETRFVGVPQTSYLYVPLYKESVILAFVNLDYIVIVIYNEF